MKQWNHVAAFGFCIVMLLTLSLSVGRTQGRYDNSISWRGVYAPSVVEIETDLLSEEGHQVIASDWEIDPASAQSKRVFQIRAIARNGTAQGNVSCKVENNAEYLTAHVDAEEFTIDEDGEVLTLTLGLTEEMKEKLETAWENRSKQRAGSGTKAEAAAPEVSAGDVSAGDVSSGDTGENAELLPMAFTVSVSFTGKGEEACVLWARFIIKLVWAEQATVSGNDVVTGSGAASGNATVSGNDAAAEIPVAEISQAEGLPLQILSATDTFSWEEWFGLTVAVPEGVARLELQYSGMAFPKGTKYRVDEEETLILGEAKEILLSQDGPGERRILLHMGQASAEYKTSQVVISLTGLDEKGNPLCFDYRTLRAREATFAFAAEDISQVIEKGGELILPTALRQEDAVWYVEYFARAEDGNLVYVKREDHYGLRADFYQQIDEENDRVLILSNGEKLAPAGSYRLVLEKVYAGAAVAHMELPFFVHY